MYVRTGRSGELTPMAILRTPIIKFRCSGQLAKTIVLYTWKSLQCVRAYVVPLDPHTPDQLVQRARMRTATRWWNHNQNTRAGRDAWNQFRTTHKKHMTGFSAFCSEIMRQIPTVPTAHFATHCVTTAPHTVTVYMQTADFSEPELEPGYFWVYYSTLPWSDKFALSVSQTIPAILTVTLPDTVALPVYLLIWKKRYRSGIMLSQTPS